MFNSIENGNRQVIPRWYSYNFACAMGELDDPRTINVPAGDSHLESKVTEWDRYREYPFAVDVLAAAFIEEDWENRAAIDAAKFILDVGPAHSRSAQELAIAFQNRGLPNRSTDISPEMDKHAIGARIALLKRQVRLYPHYAIAWAELSHSYALLGLDNYSKRSMQVALNLSTDNRYILRAATRCFLHFDDPEKSLYALRRTERTKLDPWLAAAEIALSEGINTRSKIVKSGFKLAEDDNLSDWSRNELAATLATLEAREGSFKKSKRLLKQALKMPSENTVAQAIWLNVHHGGAVEVQNISIKGAFEARARLDYNTGAYDSAFKEARRWYQYQPFTAQPVTFASYVSAVCLQNDHQALEVLKLARDTANNNPIIRNNISFSLARMGRVNEAKGELLTLNLRDLKVQERLVIRATEGLIEFRAGNLEIGRQNYREAIEGFKQLGEHRHEAIAEFFLIGEEIRVNTERREFLLEDAMQCAKRSGRPELIEVAQKLHEEK